MWRKSRIHGDQRRVPRHPSWPSCAQAFCADRRRLLLPAGQGSAPGTGLSRRRAAEDTSQSQAGRPRLLQGPGPVPPPDVPGPRADTACAGLTSPVRTFPDKNAEACSRGERVLRRALTRGTAWSRAQAALSAPHSVTRGPSRSAPALHLEERLRGRPRSSARRETESPSEVSPGTHRRRTGEQGVEKGWWEAGQE